MCGIAGIYHPKGVHQEMVKQMTDAISHRGPDAEGFFVDGEFGLGHRRLSIIDLSTAANQPMQSNCGRYWMVFNGEVYNYREIAKELDIRLKTTGDSEVILEAFAQWGPDMVNRLNGMFAIAIFDSLEKNLFLFRDRLGIKPLFVYQHNGIIAFGSELKSITALKELNLTVNEQAIPYFLHLGYIPQPLSIYKEVEKFPSGSWAVTDGNLFHVKRYWSPQKKISSNLIFDELEAKKQLSELLKASVSRRLMADVPFGTFLSGGIDSSLVTALAQNSTSEKLKTFSIGFNDAKHDESGFARQVSQHLETDHHEYRVTEKDALELVTDILPQYDEPYADSSAIPTMLVSKMARQEVTMTLSGDGGDELFHGYGMYNWAERLSNPAIQALSWPISKALSFGDDRYKRIAKVFNTSNSAQLHSHIFSQEQYMFSASEINKLLVDKEPSTFSLLQMGNHLSRKLSAADFQALFDIDFYLKDDLLTKVDRASMKYSLETRVPILDHTVVEFALNLDPKLKVKDGIQKYLLKEVLYEFVPKEIFDRPKWGFSIPLDKWLKNDLSFLIEEHLSEQRIKQVGAVKWHEVKVLKKKFFSGQSHLYNRIWLLILLHSWFSSSNT